MNFKGDDMSLTTENEEMLATAKRSIADLNMEIAKLTGLRDTWMKIAGKIEGEMYGRIMPEK